MMTPSSDSAVTSRHAGKPPALRTANDSGPPENAPAAPQTRPRRSVSPTTDCRAWDSSARRRTPPLRRVPRNQNQGGRDLGIPTSRQSRPQREESGGLFPSNGRKVAQRARPPKGSMVVPQIRTSQERFAFGRGPCWVALIRPLTRKDLRCRFPQAPRLL